MSSGVVVSLAVHALLLALIFINLPFTLSAPEQEQSVSVEIVPPPEEEPPPEETQPEEQAPEETSPDEEAPAEEQQAEPPQPPPAPATEEEQPLEEPPPPPAPEEEQPQEEPQQQEQAASEQPITEDPLEQAQGNGSQQVPIPVLRPVYQFGDDDTGEREDLQGDSAQEGAEEAADETEPVDEPQPSETADAESASGDEQALPDENALLPDDLLPGVSILDGGQSADGLAIGEESLSDPQGTENAEDTEQQVAAVQAPQLDEAKKLFSRDATDDQVATAAMRNIPRGIRADQLCLTELREQLRNASPPYSPELLPSHRLDEGTVLDARDTAFRAGGQWFNINFRCEVDQDATRVVSFAYKVGTPIPRSDWVKRRLPH